MNHFRVHRQWGPNVPKSKAKYLQNLAITLFQEAHNVVWIRLDDYKYPRTALYLPEKYRKMALYKAHHHQFGGYNAALKSYIQISSSYYWPKLWTDMPSHTKTCLVCQQSNNLQTNHVCCHLFQTQTILMLGFTQISLDQCWRLAINTSTSCASPTGA